MAESENMKVLQRTQNTLLRVLTRKKLADRVRIRDMLNDCNMLSVNQMAAQVKITEMWKAANIQDYPLKIERKEIADEKMTTRSVTRGDLVVRGKTTQMSKSFIGSATRLWYNVPNEVKNAKSLITAKKNIKTFCKTLPI